MKKLLALIILGLIGFYVAWPAWSAYRIAKALSDSDEAVLARKIDFPSVRQSLRPSVITEIEKKFQDHTSRGFGTLLSGDVKKRAVQKLVEVMLDKVVTPVNIIRIAQQGGDVSAAIEKVLMEELAKVGGLPGIPSLPGMTGGTPALPGGGLGTAGAAGPFGIPGMTGTNIPGLGGATPPAATPPPVATPPPMASTPPATKGADAGRSFGLGNLKGFHFDGPLGFMVSLAKDATATKPDVTVGMRFTDLDWKLSSVVPVP